MVILMLFETDIDTHRSLEKHEKSVFGLSTPQKMNCASVEVFCELASVSKKVF